MSKCSLESKVSQHRKKNYRRLSELLGEHLKQDLLLAPLTTFGIGGKADFFFQVQKPEELVFAVRSAQELRIPFFVLGGGSNILISDSGFRGLVIKNQCSEMVINKEAVTCQSGALLQDMVNEATERSLSGLEFAAGIPGTVGGAIRGNAGAFGKNIGDLLVKAVILTENGNVREVQRDYFAFGYRDSIVKHTGEVVLSATFGLSEKNKQDIRREVESSLKNRRERIPWQNKSAGCFFKNVDGPDGKIAAGLLLDQIGAKEMRQGDAQVWEQHANILINAGKAKATDVIKLARRLKEKVKKKFDIELEEEIVYIN
jgi:UDP-N-acetylmuramate dehydrogenase